MKLRFVECATSKIICVASHLSDSQKGSCCEVPEEKAAASHARRPEMISAP